MIKNEYISYWDYHKATGKTLYDFIRYENEEPEEDLDFSDAPSSPSDGIKTSEDKNRIVNRLLELYNLSFAVVITNRFLKYNGYDDALSKHNELMAGVPDFGISTRHGINSVMARRLSIEYRSKYVISEEYVCSLFDYLQCKGILFGMDEEEYNRDFLKQPHLRKRFLTFTTPDYYKAIPERFTHIPYGYHVLKPGLRYRQAKKAYEILLDEKCFDDKPDVKKKIQLFMQIEGQIREQIAVETIRYETMRILGEKQLKGGCTLVSIRSMPYQDKVKTLIGATDMFINEYSHNEDRYKLNWFEIRYLPYKELYNLGKAKYIIYPDETKIVGNRGFINIQDFFEFIDDEHYDSDKLPEYIIFR